MTRRETGRLFAYQKLTIIRWNFDPEEFFTEKFLHIPGTAQKFHFGLCLFKQIMRFGRRKGATAETNSSFYQIIPASIHSRADRFGNAR